MRPTDLGRPARLRTSGSRADGERTDRSVLVTGATSGIGFETALRLAGAGFRTHGSARSVQQGERLRATASDAGVVVEPVVLDLTDPDAGRDLVPSLELFGLVNNAGWANMGLVGDVPISSARRQLEAMVVAPMRLATLALPGMRARGGGRIVNVTSTAGRVAGPFLGWYEATKHALEALSEALRMETTEDGVDVVVIEPGAHRTNIWDKAERDLHARSSTSVHAEGYGRVLRILHEVEPRMPGPQPVAAAIEHALIDERPKRRYRVGADAVVSDLLGTVIPGAVRDRLLRRVFRL